VGLQATTDLNGGGISDSLIIGPRSREFLYELTPRNLPLSRSAFRLVNNSDFGMISEKDRITCWPTCVDVKLILRSNL
jgi:hypothetical protein